MLGNAGKRLAVARRLARNLFRLARILLARLGILALLRRSRSILLAAQGSAGFLWQITLARLRRLLAAFRTPVLLSPLGHGLLTRRLGAAITSAIFAVDLARKLHCTGRMLSTHARLRSTFSTLPQLGICATAFSHGDCRAALPFS